jgi:hypothetical protein
MKPSNDREAIGLILSGLESKGCTIVGVIEDTWCPDEVTVVNDAVEATDLACGVDEAYVHVDLPDGTPSWLRLVLGNDPEEVVCDHGVSLSPFIDPIVNPWWGR